MPVDRYLNSTNYAHPQESNLLDLHKAMEYNVLGEPIIRTTLGPTASDAFGRFRVSQPFTLFDNFYRYSDQERVNTYTTGTLSTATFLNNEGLVALSIGTQTNAAVYRESDRVFAYQPGKSLLILRTFCLGPAKTGLRQRVGYFDSDNGIYLERDGSTVYFVKKSKISGSVVETRVAKDNWNITTLDGTGADKIVLDSSLSQILYINIEWLGVGSVECGFVIKGQFIPCHIFHHANETGTTSTYMTTACLPIRTEIENTTATTSTSVLKDICATVISEGGYELRGRPRSIGTGLDGYVMSGNGTQILYPLVSIRLKADRLGAIVFPQNFSVTVAESAMFRWEVLIKSITTGGTWISIGDDSSVEYNLSATGFVNTGTTVEVGYIASSNQSSSSPSLAEFPFQRQLTRNTFDGTRYEFVIAMKHSGNNLKGWASINFEETT
jgi:hypothetical protein